MSEPRVTRRRRSVATTPALVDPADIPEDAAGRVAVIAVRAPEDSTEPPLAPPPDLPPLDPDGPALLTALDGWLVILVLAAVLVVLFVVGMALTR